MYSKEAVKAFLKQQGQLFDEIVAQTPEEAQEFLDECMAVEVDSIREVRKYLDGMGADVSGMSAKELMEASEVFALPAESSALCVSRTFSSLRPLVSTFSYM